MIDETICKIYKELNILIPEYTLAYSMDINKGIRLQILKISDQLLKSNSNSILPKEKKIVIYF